jgi:hypothetical protein
VGQWRWLAPWGKLSPECSLELGEEKRKQDAQRPCWWWSVFVLSGCYTKTPQAEQFRHNGNLFLTVLEAGKLLQIQGLVRT